MSDETVRRARAYAQAVGGGVREPTPYAVVRRVVAVQAQDRTAADLGIRVRGGHVTAAAVRAAYERERSIVRSWYLRGTLHTVPAEDARWLGALLGPRTIAASAGRCAQLGLDADLLARADHLITRVLANGPLTRAELTGHLAGIGIGPDGQAPFHAIRHAALRGLVCHGPFRADDATYVLAGDWLPTPGRVPEDPVVELAVRYRHGYGPAGPADFAAWSGLPAGIARAAWRQTTAPPDPDVPDGPDVRLLPTYDGYLLGYRDRTLSVPEPYRRRVWPGGGQLRPTVLADGLAVGTWSRQAGTPVVEPFAPLPADVSAALAAERDAVATYLTAAG